MPRNVWTRAAIVAAVVLLSVWYLYPPKKTINLGLDLQGGIHLVLGVETEKALVAQIDRLAADFKNALERKGIAVSRADREGDAALG
jgi:preprotein translocase subunit SecD